MAWTGKYINTGLWDVIPSLCLHCYRYVAGLCGSFGNSTAEDLLYPDQSAGSVVGGYANDFAKAWRYLKGCGNNANTFIIWCPSSRNIFSWTTPFSIYVLCPATHNPLVFEPGLITYSESRASALTRNLAKESDPLARSWLAGLSHSSLPQWHQTPLSGNPQFSPGQRETWQSVGSE